VVLAKPSCRYDPVAVQLYSEIIRSMPTGVPQRMNGLGEWFASAVSTAADVLSPVLSAIPNPYAQAAALGLGAAGKIAKQFEKKDEPTNIVAPGQTYSATGAMPAARVVKHIVKSKVRPAVIGVAKKKKKKNVKK